MEMERNQHTSPSSLVVETILSEKEKCVVKFQDIPVVDLSNPSEELVAHAVVKASEEWGIFQVVNHGIPTELIRRLQEVGTEFFELPEKEKEAVARPADAVDIEGYRKMYEKDIEGRNAWVDHLFHRVWPPSKVSYTFWPKNPQDYRFESIFFFFFCQQHALY